MMGIVLGLLSLGVCVVVGVFGWWCLVGWLIFLMGCFMVVGGADCLIIHYGGELLIDNWAYSLIVISFWVSLVSVLAGHSVVGDYIEGYILFLVTFLLLILVVSFSSTSLFGFYFYFESSLIPMFLIIMGFGYQPERLQAGIYFIFYTLTASLPLLFCIMLMYWVNGGLFMPFLSGVCFYEKSFIFSVMVLGAMLVSMPMFFIHLWLPKAHVEAPVYGSMILAGVLLKLGGYGLGRLGALTFLFGGVSDYVIGLSLAGTVWVGLICCQMNDLKALVAYSSVAHMGLVISGLFSGLNWGFLGSIMMMIGHGLSSSGLFYLVSVYYERSSSRSLFMNSGFIGILPISSMMFFFLCGGNFSVPPTVNFWSEIYLMGAILGFDKAMMLLFPLGSFLGVVFTLLMFSYSQLGSGVVMLSGSVSLLMREVHTVVMHVVPLYIVFLGMEILFL